jgi:putative oxidoreductase
LSFVNGSRAPVFYDGSISSKHERTIMFISKADFQIKSANFDLTRSRNVLRIICGAFMFPHIAGKFAGGALSAGTVGFFAKAGFAPPELWVLLAAFAEGAVGVALVLGICTRYAALGAALVLAMAVYALQVVKGFGWTWNTGGYEYPVFWAITSVAVAMDAWKVHAASGRKFAQSRENTTAHRHAVA